MPNEQKKCCERCSDYEFDAVTPSCFNPACPCHIEARDLVVGKIIADRDEEESIKIVLPTPTEEKIVFVSEDTTYEIDHTPTVSKWEEFSADEEASMGTDVTREITPDCLTSNLISIDEVIDKVMTTNLEINIDEYLPMVKRWEGGYDVPFDDGYNQAKKDITNALSSLKRKLEANK